jgi:DNA-binding GntR family transcriptional regulator
MRPCPGDTKPVLGRRRVREIQPPSTLPQLTKTADQTVRVAKAIRLAIVSGGFVAGERLVPERLATELGVSRPPVTAALRQLEREDLVTIGKNGRPYVAGLTPRYVADMYSFRMMLDQTIVSSVAAKPFPVDAGERLHSIVALMKIRAREGDLATFVDLDMDFHTVYLSLAGNRFLARAWEALSDTAYAILTVTDRLSQALPCIADIHEEILSSIQAADAPWNLAALYRHYQFGEAVLADRDLELWHPRMQSEAECSA